MSHERFARGRATGCLCAGEVLKAARKLVNVLDQLDWTLIHKINIPSENMQCVRTNDSKVCIEGT